MLFEWGYVALGLGIWDENDIYASLAGAGLAVVVWFMGREGAAGPRPAAGMSGR